ncbi:MAG: hypothetical protein ACD_71C00176G0002 [uncultured bacterium (gcode 4)]|uniref:Uncharacterized protein n=1 Tax=uncultured bacterium (gcode 4) TaxID=1234023 RepID=K1Z459_9BACT|nr:MAG: hypothetical protein ACD_71C00176G0002 [uncultured bacterium (gcode 4)]
MLNNKFIKSTINVVILLLILAIILFFVIPGKDWNESRIKEAREKYEQTQSGYSR